MQASARRAASASGTGRPAAAWAASTSWTATTYQSEASTALYSGTAPRSGKRFGIMPSFTAPAQARRIARACASAPVATRRPRNAMKVSRPQSVNHGKPATRVRPPERSTR